MDCPPELSSMPLSPKPRKPAKSAELPKPLQFCQLWHSMCITNSSHRSSVLPEIVSCSVILGDMTTASTVRSRIRRHEKMGKLAMSHWVVSTMAMFMGLGNFLAAQSSDAATNPWSRAIGEAKELHWETEDLQNRLNRLYPGSPAAQLSGALDESALALVEMVQKGADLYQLQMGLQTFKSIQVQLCQIASQDCRIHSDQTTVRYLKKVEDRYNYLVTDLSKCRLPTTSCPTHPIPTFPSQVIPIHGPCLRHTQVRNPRFLPALACLP